MDLKQIPFEKIKKEWDSIKKLCIQELNEINEKSKLGCNIVDYYFFEQRLKTKGNKGINFYEFVENIEYYKTKKYIQTLLLFCDKNNRYKDSDLKRYYYIYGLSFGRVNAFKITNALKIYHTYKPTSILDPFCGFGGRFIASMMMNTFYTGIDVNRDLKPEYERMIKDFNIDSTKYELLFQNSLLVDYSKIEYDMVFTSPPYELLWDNLKKGTFIININEKIYKSILIPLLGECHTRLVLSKSKRNNYIEYIYVWVKTI